jgi:hypothetical protein
MATRGANTPVEVNAVWLEGNGRRFKRFGIRTFELAFRWSSRRQFLIPNLTVLHKRLNPNG